MRAAPAMRTAWLKAICERPGTTAPMAAKARTSRARMGSENEPETSAMSVTTRKPVVAVTAAPSSTGTPRESP